MPHEARPFLRVLCACRYVLTYYIFLVHTYFYYDCHLYDKEEKDLEFRQMRYLEELSIRRDGA